MAIFVIGEQDSKEELLLKSIDHVCKHTQVAQLMKTSRLIISLDYRGYVELDTGDEAQ